MKQQDGKSLCLIGVAHCLVCQREVETVSTVEADALLKIAGRIFEAAIASGQVHLIPFASGSSLVCKASLFGTEGRKR